MKDITINSETKYSSLIYIADICSFSQSKLKRDANAVQYCVFFLTKYKDQGMHSLIYLLHLWLTPSRGRLELSLNFPSIFKTLFFSIYIKGTFGHARSNVKYCLNRANNLTTKILERARLVMLLGAAFNNTKFLCRGCLLTRSYVNAAS